VALSINLNDLKLRTSLAFNELLDRVMRAVQTPEESPSSRPLELEQLEDRVLLSASPAAVVMEAAASASSAGQMDTFDSASLSTGQSSADTASPNATDVDAVIAETDLQAVREDSSTNRDAETGDLSTTRSDQTVRQELVFVDTSVDDYQQLLDDLWSNDNSSREFEVVLLQNSRDGIEQITEALAGRTGVDAMHVVSHGTDTAIKLGSTWLTQDNLSGYAGEIAGWANALSSDADLLFYGCDLAASSDGQQLVDSISALTEADVAASNDDTGHAIFGADWDLEYSAGQIETQIAFSQDAQDNWGHLLNVAVDSTSTGSTTGSTLNISHTTSGSNRLMLVGVSIGEDFPPSVSSITYDGSKLTSEGFVVSSDGGTVEIFSLVAPSVGTFDVIVTLSGAGDANVGVMTFTDVDQTTPLGTFASASGDDTNGTVAVSSAADELVFGVVTVNALDQNLVPGAGQTEQWDLFTGVESNGGASTEAGAASVDMSWTWTDSTGWAIGGISIKPVSSSIVATFQHNVSGYTGTQDTYLSGDSPDTDFGASARIEVDAVDVSFPSQALIRFDSLFGDGAGQIPWGSTITSASLTVDVSNPGASGNTYDLHRMQTDWDESSTWNSLSTGLQSGTDYLSAIESSVIDPASSGTETITGLEGSVAEWANGTTNLGWAIVTTNTNGWDFDSSEGTTPPILSVTYVAPAASQSSAAHTLVVDSTEDVVDGDTSSIDNLIASDGGEISLREAILAANNTTNSGGPDSIEFSIGGGGTQTISLLSALPALTDAVTIDGRSQPLYSTTPIIRLEGSSAAFGVNGLFATADDIKIQGLVVNDFVTGTGIKAIGADNLVVRGNFVGVNVAGTGAAANYDGIDVIYSDNVTVGGTSSEDRNVVSGNLDDGIDLDNVRNSSVVGNYIGLDINGAALGNGDDGIIVEAGATGNTIGGLTEAERNYIADHTGAGIAFHNASGNTVVGNYIGTNATGVDDRGNQTGIELDSGSSNNTIGGTASGAGNRIVHNAKNGITALDGTGNAFRGNDIYLNAVLAIDLGNDGHDGRDVNDVDTGPNNKQNPPFPYPSTTDGTTVTFVGEFYYGTPSTNYEFDFFASSTSTTGVGGRYLGSATIMTDASGDIVAFNEAIAATAFPGEFITSTVTDPLGNTSEFSTTASITGTGIIEVTNTNDLINGTVTSLAALYMDDGGDGISLREAITAANATTNGTTPDEIHFEIGEALAGGAHTISLTSALPEIDDTVIIDGTTDIDFGTTPIIVLDGSSAGGVDGLRLIAGSGGSTVRGLAINQFLSNGITLDSSANSVIEGNYIGLDPDGTTGRGNTINGINVTSSNGVTIGGPDTTDRNIISDNSASGILLFSSSNVTVQGNYIGTTSSGNTSLGNAARGILIIGDSDNNQIGGTGTDEKNVIGGNAGAGIDILDVGGTPESNVIEGNFIGVGVDGSSDIGNSGDGILLQGSGTANNRVGGTAAGEGNIIAYNDAGGIKLLSTAGTGNALLGNLIFANTDLGIDLASATENGFGVNANDADDADTGPNDYQNFPVLATAVTDGSSTITIDGTLDTDGLTQDYRIEFFASSTGDASSYGEAERYLGSVSTTTNGSGVAAFSAVLSETVAAGEVITATATVDLGLGDYGDTSEFAINVLAALPVNTRPYFGAGGDGSVTTPVPGSALDFGFDSVVQSDGKVIVAGASNLADFDFSLVRYNADGSIDQTFGGGDGIVTFDAGGNEFGFDVALQTDGKIIVVGQTDIGADNDILVARFNSDGTLDTTFDGDGYAITNVSGDDNSGAIAIQTDGKIVVAGDNDGGGNDFSVVRYNTDGSLDTTFDSDGILTLDFGGSSFDTATAVALQSDGKIVVGGLSSLQFGLIRLTTTGVLDTSFDTDGVVTTDFGAGSETINGLAIQADGRIVAGGTANLDFALARYNTNGSLDTTFDTDGLRTSDLGGTEQAYDIALTSSEKILISGSTTLLGNNDVMVQRYNSDGSTDRSFNTVGTRITVVGVSNEVGYSVNALDDGSVLVGGYTSSGGFLLNRYVEAGPEDSTFGATTNLLNGNPTFTEGGAPVVLDADVQVFDAELSAVDSFNGATLTLVRDGGADSDDEFSATGNLSTLTESGNLVLSSTTIGTVTTNSSGSLVLTFNGSATQAAVNETLQSIAYSNSSDNPPASALLTWTFSDGNTGIQGTGGALAATGSTTVNITASNDAPVATIVPVGYGVTEDDPARPLGGVSISDVDAGVNDLEVTLSVNDGDVTLVTTTGLTFTGGANGTSTLTVTGTQTDLNNALATLTYQPDPNFAGSDTLTLTVDDLGNTGGGALNDVDTANITVTADNDAPTITAIADQTPVEDTATGPIAFTIGDVETAASSLIVTATSNDQTQVPDTNITLGGSGASRTIDILPGLNQNGGPATITVTVDDGTTTTQTTFDVTVTAANDAPVGVVASNFTAINEDDFTSAGKLVSAFTTTTVDVDLGAVKGVAVIDVDNTNGSWEYTLDGTNWLAIGNVSDSMARLLPSDATARVRFVPDPNYNGVAFPFTVVAWDQTTGVAGGLADASTRGGITAFSTASATVGQSVTSINDTPIATADPGDYSADLLALNPLSYWRLGESSGTTASDIGSLGNDGTYQGTTLGQTGSITGDSDTAAQFNGTSDYLEFAHDNSYLLDNGTVQLWFSADDPTGAAEQHLFSKDSSSFDTGGHLTIYLKTSGQLEVRLQSTSADNFATTASAVSSGTWHHVAVAFGSDGLKLYLDGALTDTDSYTGGLGTTSGGAGNFEPIAIGAGTQSSGDLSVTPVNEFFSGLIDEVAIVGSSLSAETVQDLYAAGLQHYTVVHDTTLNVTAAAGVLANDYDVEGDSLNAVVVSGPSNADSFTLNGDGSFDYAPTAGFSGSDSFTYKANDGSLDSGNVTVTLTVTNEVPVITSDGGGATAAVNVAENSTAVTTVTATDADLPAETLTYSITGGADAAKFAINSSTGALTFAVAPDFETPTDVGTDNIYDVTVQVSDGTLTDTQAISVTVTSLNDNTPTITSNGGGASAAVNMAENSTAVTTVTATDADLPGDTLAYSITGGADAAKFAINSSTGALTFALSPDFETPTDVGTDNVYDVTVQVSDGSLIDTQAISVTVTPVNDNTPVITSNGGGASAALNVAENSTAVTTVTATDADLRGDTLTYSISGGADAAKFAINSSTGVLRFALAPDFETPTDVGTDNVYDVTVQVSDGTLTDTQAIAVTVTPLNDNTPTITSGGGGASAARNRAENNTAITTVTATDADLRGDTLTYSISGGADAAKFAINSSTGVLRFAVAPDFETPTDVGTDNVYDVIVEVSDGTFTDTQSIAVTVTAVNDNTPTITSDGGGASAALNVAENATAVTTVTATDADLPGDTLTYSISGGADAAKFLINSSSGDLTFAAAPDFETPTDVGTDNVYEVTVEASDGAGGTDSQAISVTVTDVDEFDVTAVADVDGTADAVDENSANGTTVGITASASDADATTNGILYTLDDNAGGQFAIDGATGIVTVAGAIDRESGATRSITVRATSDDGSTTTQGFVIAINDLDEFDITAISDSDATLDAVDENALAIVVVAATSTDTPDDGPDDPGPGDTDDPGEETGEPSAPGVPADTTPSGTAPPTTFGQSREISGLLPETDSESPLLIASTESFDGSIRDEQFFTLGRGRANESVSEFVQTFEATLLEADSDLLVQLIESGYLWESLDNLDSARDEADSVDDFAQNIVVGTTGVVGTSLTVGYVIWLLRGGSLLVGMVSSLPAWTMIDPLPVLESAAETMGLDEDGDSLESLLRAGQQA